MASRCAAFPLRIVHGLVTVIMSSRAVLRCSATYFDFCPVLSGPGLVGSFPTNHDGLRRVTSCPEISGKPSHSVVSARGSDGVVWRLPVGAALDSGSSPRITINASP